jgi:hypothetical protein
MPSNPDPCPSTADLGQIKNVAQNVTYHLRHIATLGHAPGFDVEAEWGAVNDRAWDLWRLMNQIWLRRATPTKENSTSGLYQGYHCLIALTKQVYLISPTMGDGRQVPRTRKVDDPGGHADAMVVAVRFIEEGVKVHTSQPGPPPGYMAVVDFCKSECIARTTVQKWAEHGATPDRWKDPRTGRLYHPEAWFTPRLTKYKERRKAKA